MGSICKKKDGLGSICTLKVTGMKISKSALVVNLHLKSTYIFGGNERDEKVFITSYFISGANSER